jgi:hypothetical protein
VDDQRLPAQPIPANVVGARADSRFCVNLIAVTFEYIAPAAIATPIAIIGAGIRVGRGRVTRNRAVALLLVGLSAGTEVPAYEDNRCFRRPGL